MKFYFSKLDNTLLNKVQNFSCGDNFDEKILNSFLQEKALTHQLDLISTTLIVFDSKDKKNIVGYITLLVDSIQVEDKNVKKQFFNTTFLKNNKYSTYPAVKIGRLAVDNQHKGKGIGKFLFNLTVALTKELNETIGARFIVVDSKKEPHNWYLKKLNFKLLDPSKPDFLYYDLKGWRK
jgi:predicted GNAT family N-acyltransferase